MSNILKWLLPVTAALGLVMGISALSAKAEDAKDAKTGKGSITGTVTDKDAKAVEGVEVRLMKPRQRGGGAGAATQAALGTDPIALQQRQPPTPIATATTDKDGKFTMKDVAVGDYMVGVRDRDKEVFARTGVTVEEGKTATVEIKCSDQPPARGGGGGGAGGARPGNPAEGGAKQ